MSAHLLVHPAPVAWLSELMELPVRGFHEKLAKLRLSRTPEETTRLLGEVKKYLVIANVETEREVPMFSSRVDEIWHQLVLFTAQYQAMCDRFFSTFQHHDPRETSETRPSGEGGGREKLDFGAFCTIYERIFGPVDDAWFEDRGLTQDTRVERALWGRPITLRRGERAVEVVLQRDEPVVLCRVPTRMTEALEALMDGATRYVRELPLDAEARLALCRPLLTIGVLRVVP